MAFKMHYDENNKSTEIDSNMTDTAAMDDMTKKLGKNISFKRNTSSAFVGNAKPSEAFIKMLKLADDTLGGTDLIGKFKILPLYHSIGGAFNSAIILVKDVPLLESKTGKQEYLTTYSVLVMTSIRQDNTAVITSTNLLNTIEETQRTGKVVNLEEIMQLNSDVTDSAFKQDVLKEVLKETWSTKPILIGMYMMDNEAEQHINEAQFIETFISNVLAVEPGHADLLDYARDKTTRTVIDINEGKSALDTFSVVARQEQHSDTVGVAVSRNRLRNSAELLAEVSGYVETYHEVVSSTDATGRIVNNPMFRPYIVLTSLGGVLPSLQNALIDFVIAGAMLKDGQWIRPLSANLNFSNIGILDGHLNNDRKATLINTKAMSNIQVNSEINRIVSGKPVLLLEMTDNKSFVLDTLIKIANGDQGAYKLLITAAYELTEGRFPLDYTGPIFETPEIKTLNGTYITPKTKVPIKINAIPYAFISAAITAKTNPNDPNDLNFKDTVMATKEMSMEMNGSNHLLHSLRLLRMLDANVELTEKTLRKAFAPTFLQHLENALTGRDYLTGQPQQGATAFNFFSKKRPVELTVSTGGFGATTSNQYSWGSYDSNIQNTAGNTAYGALPLHFMATSLNQPINYDV